MNYDESHPSCVRPSQKSVATRSYLVSASLEFPQDQTLVMPAVALTSWLAMRMMTARSVAASLI